MYRFKGICFVTAVYSRRRSLASFDVVGLLEHYLLFFMFTSTRGHVVFLFGDLMASTFLLQPMASPK